MSNQQKPTTRFNLCDDEFIHIYQYIDTKSLFETILPLSTRHRNLVLHSIDQFTKQRFNMFVEWFLGYTCTRVNFQVYEEFMKESENERVAAERMNRHNYDLLRREVSVLESWIQFMNDVTTVMIPHLLFRYSWMRLKSQSDTITLIRSLCQLFDIVFALEHLKVFQSHVHNDYSMYNRFAIGLDVQPTAESQLVKEIMRSRFYFIHRLHPGCRDTKSWLNPLKCFAQEPYLVKEMNENQRLRIALLLMSMMRALVDKKTANKLSKGLPELETCRRKPLLDSDHSVAFSARFFMQDCVWKEVQKVNS